MKIQTISQEAIAALAEERTASYVLDSVMRGIEVYAFNTLGYGAAMANVLPGGDKEAALLVDLRDQGWALFGDGHYSFAQKLKSISDSQAFKKLMAMHKAARKHQKPKPQPQTDQADEKPYAKASDSPALSQFNDDFLAIYSTYTAALEQEQANA